MREATAARVLFAVNLLMVSPLCDKRGAFWEMGISILAKSAPKVI